MQLGSYLLGPNDTKENGIYVGDARELSLGIPDGSIDLVLTDPPYGIGFKYTHGYRDVSDGYCNFVRWIISESNRVIKPGGLCFVFQAMPRLRETWQLFPDDSRLFAACKNFTQYRPTSVQFSFDPVIFWQKPGQPLVSAMAGRRDWHIGNTALYVTQGGFHDCPRPLNTIIYMVHNFCPPDGIVLDWFMGSGTTAVAAKVTGRHYWGCEIDPTITELARQRVVNTQPPLFVPEMQQAEFPA